MRRFGLLGLLALFACACGDDSSSEIGESGTGGIAGSSGSSTGGASTGGSGGAASGGTAGASTGGTAGTASGGMAGTASGGSGGAAGGPCHPSPSQDAECAGKPPHLYGCFNGAPYDPPAGCVNIYIGNATDFWCCP
jgi:hypothetical protein